MEIMKVKVRTGLRMRICPGFDGRVVGVLSNKTIVEVSQKSDDGMWYKLEAIIPSKPKNPFKKVSHDFEYPVHKIRVNAPRWICSKYLKKYKFTPSELYGYKKLFG